MGDLMFQTMGIDVTRRAESIGDGPSSWGGHHIPQPETTPCVTLSRSVSRCHALCHADFLAAVFKFLAVLADFLAAALAAALLYCNRRLPLYYNIAFSVSGRPARPDRPTGRGHVSRSVSRSGGWGPWWVT